MGKFTKYIGRKPAVQRVLSAIAASLIGTVKLTTRWQTINGTVAESAWAGQKPIIVAFWHNRLAMMPACWLSPEPFHMLISSHPDGRLIAGTVAHFGISAVAGSSTRGGGEAVRQLVRHLKNGESIGVTPDGPRGPRMHVGDGILMLARLSGVPIVPASISVSRRILLNTWDKLIIPLPFGRGAMIWGEPISVPRDADDAALAELRQKLAGELNRVSADADTMMGHSPILPAEPAHARA